MDETNNADPCSLQIYAEATGDALPFSADNYDLSRRPRTQTAVSWQPPPWTSAGAGGPAQRTPDLSALLQEVVNRGDYLETGAIAILIEGTGRRVAESFDGEADKAPILRVEYRLINFDCPENEADIGDPCDDGDPCTVNDAYDGDCHCAGTVLDEDGNGISDCEEPAGPDRAICPGTCVTIGKAPDEEHPEYCYTWGPYQEVGEQHSSTLEVCPEKTTTYTLFITNDQGEFILADEVTVEVLESLADFEVSVDPEELWICPGEPTTIEAIVTGESTYSYLWSTGETTVAIVVSPARSTEYEVEVTDETTGCKLTRVAWIPVKTPPYIDIIASDPEICHLAPIQRIEKRLDSDDCDTYSLLIAGTGLPGYSYLWSTGETESTIKVTEPGEYSVTVTNDDTSCHSEASIEIESCLDVTIEPGTVLIDNEEVFVYDAGEGFLSYLWNNGSREQTINLDGPGEYAVTVTDENGCMASDNVTIGSIADPSDVFLAFHVWDDTHRKRNIYVCVPEELDPGVKAVIEKDLKFGDAAKLFPPPPIDDNGNRDFEPEIIWTCDVKHREEKIIDKNNGTSALHLYPLIYKDYGSGPQRQIQYTKTLPSGEYQYAYYQFKLVVEGQEKEVDFSLKKYLPVSDFANLAEMVNVQLFTRNEDGGYNPAPDRTMNIAFKPKEVTTHQYVLFYNGQEAPAEITEKEQINVEFEIKQKDNGGGIIDAKNILWKEDGRPLYGYSDVRFIHRTKKYSTDTNSDNSYLVAVEINEKYNLKVLLHIQPKPFVPGYSTEGTASNLQACQKGGMPEAYLEEAKARIQQQDSEMYNALIQNRHIDIVLTDGADKELGDYKTGIKFGSSSFNLIGDPRIVLDPVKADFDTNIRGKFKKSATCPIDAPLLLRLSEDETNLILSAINNNKLYVDDPLEVKTVVDRVKATYEEYGRQLETFCDAVQLNREELDDVRKEFHALNNQGKFSYYATDSELNNLIQFPNYGAIYLAVDNLCYIPDYVRVDTEANTQSFITDKEKAERWYQNLPSSVSPSHQLHKIREDKYTSILAHEMAHIYYELNNKIEAYKWRLLTTAFPVFKEESEDNKTSCYPYRYGVNDDGYCSSADGHEYMNPNGLSTCGTEIKYKVDPLRIN